MINNEHEVVNTDETFSSRKFILVLVGLALVLAGGILASKMPGFAPAYETFIGGDIALVALYLTGNVSEKFLGGKVNALVKIAALTRPKDVPDQVVDQPVVPPDEDKKE